MTKPDATSETLRFEEWCAAQFPNLERLEKLTARAAWDAARAELASARAGRETWISIDDCMPTVEQLYRVKCIGNPTYEWDAKFIDGYGFVPWSSSVGKPTHWSNAASGAVTLSAEDVEGMRLWMQSEYSNTHANVYPGMVAKINRFCDQALSALGQRAAVPDTEADGVVFCGQCGKPK